VQAHAGHGQRRGPVGRARAPRLAEQVGHGRGGRLGLDRAQRQAADRAHLLLELAGRVGVDRQMAGVVRPRRELVDDQLTAGEREQLHAQHPDHVEPLQHSARDRERLAPRARIHPRRPQRHVQDVVGMGVLEGLVQDHAAVHPARSDHGDLALEGHPALQHGALPAQRAPGLRQLGRPGHPPLALAVVAPGSGLEHPPVG
jgi:hypothetical protein